MYYSSPTWLTVEQQKLNNQMSRFLLRQGLNVNGFSEMVIVKIIERGITDNLPDLYKASKSEFRRIPGLSKRFGGEDLYKSLHESKRTTLVNFISGLGINGISKTKAKVLAETFPTIGRLMNVTPRDLLGVPTLGHHGAVSILEYFSDDANIDLICALREEAGIHW